MGIILFQWVNSAALIVHSGLGIYISDDYNFKVMNMHEQSMLWDGMFVEISGQSLNDKKNNSWKYLSATEKHYRRL